MEKECPVTKIVDVVSRKWALLILRQLIFEKKRFNELLKEIHGISPRTLSKRLSELEKSNIIKKKQFNEIPPRVEYSLTNSGLELIRCFKSLDNWAKKWEKLL
ncbi:MAG: helix-turn-helix domain-containing protein [Nanoarchaeota archaeon]|nr:helix-turn-helix domain-containing protein [Nanoarchaeota archaeon]